MTSSVYEESPSVWVTDSRISKHALELAARKLDNAVNEPFSTPKGQTFQYFAMALVQYGLGLKEKAKESVCHAIDLLLREDFLSSDANEDERKEELKLHQQVLRVLLSRFAADLSLGEEKVKSLAQGDTSDRPLVVSSVEEQAMLHHYKGKFYVKIGLLQDAEEEFEASNRKSPVNTFSCISLGMRIRARRKREDRTCSPDPREIELFERRYKAERDPVAAVLLAEAEMHNFRYIHKDVKQLPYDQKEPRLKKIVSLADFALEKSKKRRVETLRGCAEIFIALPYWFGKQSRGIELLQDALKLAPNNSSVHHLLGKQMIKRGNYEQGLSHLQQAFNTGKNVYAHLDYMSVRFAREGRAFDFNAEFQAARESTEDVDFDAILVLVAWAQVKAQMNDHRGALDLLDEAGKLQETLGVSNTKQYDEFPGPMWGRKSAYWVKVPGNAADSSCSKQEEGNLNSAPRPLTSWRERPHQQQETGTHYSSRAFWGLAQKQARSRARQMPRDSTSVRGSAMAFPGNEQHQPDSPKLSGFKLTISQSRKSIPQLREEILIDMMQRSC